MREMLRRALGAGLAILVTGTIVVGSRSTVSFGDGDQAALRLSWSGRPERIETCRRLSAEELAAMPAHMRREVECEGHPARYLVRASDGTTTLMADTVTGGGVRGDRAIHMLRDLPLAPGRHHLVVEVLRVDEVVGEEEPGDTATAAKEELWRPGLEDRERREGEERRRQRLDRLPPELRWALEAELGAGKVVLVTYDPIARRLVGGP